MSWKAIGFWVAKVLTQAALEKFAKGLAEGKSPTAEK